MKIWLINHYAVPPQYYPLPRPSLFAKNLISMGHEVTIIAASTAHNTDIDLIEGDEKYKTDIVDGIPYIFVKCSRYQGNGIGRIINILQFAVRYPKVCKRLDKPDAIVATSFDLLTCYQGIRFAKKRNIRAIAEIADLWPESMVTYGMASAGNPIVKILRRIEKSIYTHADAIIFTMDGAYDYIEEQRWEQEVPKSKVFYINNGVDIGQFDYNRSHFCLDDPDLEEKGTYKIIYAGSLRKTNSQIYSLFDAIELMQGDRFSDYRFFIYGKGDIEDDLIERCKAGGIKNVLFKGFVDKKYIPFILSKCDLNILNCKADEVLKYGGSQNKLFEYLASGHPILSGEDPTHSVVANEKCGISRKYETPQDIVEAIQDIRQAGYQERHIRSVAEKYDYTLLSRKLLDVIEGVR